MPFEIDLPLIKDTLILIICATTCLYCIVLSQRLKGLTSSKSGMVASIVELTQAIHDSHQAAKQIQKSAEQSIQTLNDLLDDAQGASVKLEALNTETKRRHNALAVLARDAKVQIDTTLPESISSARKTASALLKLLMQLRSHQNNLKSELNHSNIAAKTTPNITQIHSDAT